RACGFWSDAICVMSSAVRLIGPAWFALTCQKIRPTEKTTPTPAAIQALVVEFKICFPFKSKKNCFTARAEPVRSGRHPSMMDEQRRQGNLRRLSGVLRRLNGHPSISDAAKRP